MHRFVSLYIYKRTDRRTDQRIDMFEIFSIIFLTKTQKAMKVVLATIHYYFLLFFSLDHKAPSFFVNVCIWLGVSVTQVKLSKINKKYKKVEIKNCFDKILI